jgi:cob(I)alamin adenosyltransferase
LGRLRKPGVLKYGRRAFFWENFMFENFDWSIKFGDVLTLAGAVYVGSTFLYRRGGSDAVSDRTLHAITKEISEIKSELSEFSKALVQLAVQDTKIDMLMKWYDELRRGIGKVE